MYSLEKIVVAMEWNGGWIDLLNKEIIKDIFVRYQDGSYQYHPTDCNGNIISICPGDNRYLRIPSFRSEYFLQYALKKACVPVHILMKHGIDKYMDINYPIFLDDKEIRPYINDDLPVFQDRAFRLLEDMGIEQPDLREHGMDEVLAWCSSNNIDVVDDYIEID